MRSVQLLLLPLDQPDIDSRITMHFVYGYCHSSWRFIFFISCAPCQWLIFVRCIDLRSCQFNRLAPPLYCLVHIYWTGFVCCCRFVWIPWIIIEPISIHIGRPMISCLCDGLQLVCRGLCHIGLIKVGTALAHVDPILLTGIKLNPTTDG